MDQNFITWIEILLKDQLSCVINGGTTTQYFNLERDARQGDPNSACLFILTLKNLFFLIKKHPKIKHIETFEHRFLYTAWADDITFFLKDSQWTAYLVALFNTFSVFFRIKTKSN